jgi:predicted RNase H-like HicB family nuclease
MRLAGVLEQGEDGYVVVSCPALPGCYSQGRTEAEALASIREAVEAWMLAANDRQRRGTGGRRKRRVIDIEA